MWEKETKSVPQRIVSITQPHIRPIVRGKAGKTTEFGAKLSVSYIGFAEKVTQKIRRPKASNLPLN